MQSYNVIPPSHSSMRNFETNSPRLQDIARDEQTAEHMTNAMSFLIAPIVLAPETDTEQWKRNPHHPLHQLATANKLRYNSITGPLRFIHLQGIFCRVQSEKLASDAKVLMNQLQNEYRQMLLPHKLAYLRKVDKLIMRFFLFVKANESKEVAL